MQDRSGWEYDAVTRCPLGVDDDVWEAFVAERKWALEWRYQPIRWRTELEEIFGGSGATGRRARAAGAVASMESSYDDGTIDPTLMDDVESIQDDSTTTSQYRTPVLARRRGSTTSQGSGRRTTTTVSLSDVVAMMSESINKLVEQRVDPREKAINLLWQMPEISATHRKMVERVFLRDPEAVVLFLGRPAWGRDECIQEIIQAVEREAAEAETSVDPW